MLHSCIPAVLSLHSEIALKKEKIFNEVDVVNRKTKIIATLGPTSNKKETIIQMLEAGMNVARLSFVIADHNTNLKILQNYRAALRERPEFTCALMLDLKGPEIRTGLLENGKEIKLEKDHLLEITNENNFIGNERKIACTYEDLTTLPVGNKVFIDYGKIQGKIVEIKKDSIIVKIKHDCVLGEKKNITFPGVSLNLPFLNDEDEDILINIALKEGVDIVAASHIRNASDIDYIKDVLGPKGVNIKIISKIENMEALEKFEEILEASDGIMIARGHLGMELPIEKIFITQKYLIDRTNIAGKPIITATQMLESMIKNPNPTRAEATDIANAVIDGTDCVMLSQETAVGIFPVEAVKIMSKICTEAESVLYYQNLYGFMMSHIPKPLSVEESVCATAVKTAYEIDAKIIIIITETGALARMIAKYKPKQLVLALCVKFSVIKTLNLTRGIKTLRIASNIGTNNLVNDAINYIVSKGFAKQGDKILALLCQNEETPENANLMKISTVE